MKSNFIIDCDGVSCKVIFDRYVDNDTTCILLVTNDDSEEIQAKCTVNIEIVVPENYVVIKDYGENEGMIDNLLRENVIDEEVFRGDGIGVYRLTDRANEERKRQMSECS